MNQAERKEYEDISYLIKTPEWREYVSYLKKRKAMLEKRVVSLVLVFKHEEAGRLAATASDIERQILMFTKRLDELDKEKEALQSR